MNLVADKSERVNCPFDPVHVVERRRLQAHIIKCKRNLPPGHDFVECNFWYLHYVRRHQLEEHHENCPHRLTKEANKRMWEEEPSKFYEPKLVVDPSILQQQHVDESWDDECSGPVFDLEKHRASANHMPVPDGLSKSKRKMFREEQRERLRKLEDAKPTSVAKTESEPIPASSAVNSKPTNNVLPLPRQPENRQPGVPGVRIAAKFPDIAPVESPGQSRSRASSASSSFFTACDSVASAGRGRGRLMGWNQVAEPKKPPGLSYDDFPAL